MDQARDATGGVYFQFFKHLFGFNADDLQSWAQRVAAQLGPPVAQFSDRARTQRWAEMLELANANMERIERSPPLLTPMSQLSTPIDTQNMDEEPTPYGSDGLKRRPGF